MSETFNREATEKALVGCLILKPELFEKVNAIIRLGDFRHIGTQTVYAAMIWMRWNHWKELGPAGIVAALKMLGNYEYVGGAGYLADLVIMVPHVDHAEYYASLLRGVDA